jgi:hypothetical protein
MATTDDRLFRHSDEIEREAIQAPVIDQDADRPKSGVLGFGATVSTYFVAAVALAVVMVLVIVLFAM